MVIGILLLAAPLVFHGLRASRMASPELLKEMRIRYVAWLILVPLLVLPILAGRPFAIAAVLLIALGCYREFSRATGFFRHRLLSTSVLVSIGFTYFSVFDHWYGFFVALPSLSIALLVIVALLSGRSKGYIQRTGLAFMSVLMFATCFGHVAYFSNDVSYQAILLMLILCVELNDIFAFCCGKVLGRRKLCPGISPNKTLEGCLGALALTTGVFYVLSGPVFTGTALESPMHRLTMGLLLAAMGQLGDLVVSAIKRDLQVKDMGQTIPGHGGFLDRFDSLIFVGPVLFHYIGYFEGVGLDQPVRLFTGGG